MNVLGELKSQMGVDRRTDKSLFIWHLSYLKSNTKYLTDPKNNNDKTN